MPKLKCPACRRAGESTNEAHFEIMGRADTNAVVRCVRCGQGFLKPPIGRAKPIPPAQWTEIVERHDSIMGAPPAPPELSPELEHRLERILVAAQRCHEVYDEARAVIPKTLAMARPGMEYLWTAAIVSYFCEADGVLSDADQAAYATFAGSVLDDLGIEQAVFTAKEVEYVFGPLKGTALGDKAKGTSATASLGMHAELLAEEVCEVDGPINAREQAALDDWRTAYEDMVLDVGGSSGRQGS